MSDEAITVRRDFVLKQIENEVNAGFVFVSAARDAYKHLRSEDGDGALEKALQAHQEALRQMSHSELRQVRGIVHQITELREAIDWLLETHFEQMRANRK